MPMQLVVARPRPGQIRIMDPDVVDAEYEILEDETPTQGGRSQPRADTSAPAQGQSSGWFGALKSKFRFGQARLGTPLLVGISAALLLGTIFGAYKGQMALSKKHEKGKQAAATPPVPTKYQYRVREDPYTRAFVTLITDSSGIAVHVPPGYDIWSRPDRNVGYDAIVHLNGINRGTKIVAVPAYSAEEPVRIRESFDAITWRLHSSEPVHFYVCVHQPDVPCPDAAKVFEQADQEAAPTPAQPPAQPITLVRQKM